MLHVQTKEKQLKKDAFRLLYDESYEMKKIYFLHRYLKQEITSINKSILKLQDTQLLLACQEDGLVDYDGNIQVNLVTKRVNSIIVAITKHEDREGVYNDDIHALSIDLKRSVREYILRTGFADLDRIAYALGMKTKDIANLFVGSEEFRTTVLASYSEYHDNVMMLLRDVAQDSEHRDQFKAINLLAKATVGLDENKAQTQIMKSTAASKYKLDNEKLKMQKELVGRKTGTDEIMDAVAILEND